MSLTPSTIASIPSPSFDSLGPLNLYGLSIALGVIAAVWLFGRRLAEREWGTPDDASSIAVWAVIAGVIGARLYHVATDWERFEDDLGAIVRLWEGGLGIPGGLLLGIPVGLWMARSKGIPISVAATCAAPAIPLAQAIGRWGNYFNQELYGRPTDLPWALEIDEIHLVEGYAAGTTFHPTFLYESLWSLALAGLLIVLDRRVRMGPGALMGLYLAGYGAGRFWIEGLRIDPADEVAGLRWNQWVALAAVVGGLALFAALRQRPWPEPPRLAASADVDVEHLDHHAAAEKATVADDDTATDDDTSTGDDTSTEVDTATDDDTSTGDDTSTEDDTAIESGEDDPMDDSTPVNQRRSTDAVEAVDSSQTDDGEIVGDLGDAGDRRSG